MTPHTPDSSPSKHSTRPKAQDDVFSRLLADYDEALARDPSIPPIHIGLDDDLDDELRERLALATPFLDLIAEVFPRAHPADDGDGAIGTGSASGPEGQRFGRFLLIRELGRGGFGVVYLAEDTASGELIALKVPLLKNLNTEDGRRRFRREADVAKSLDHPNIVPVLESGNVGTIGYIISEYCDGPTMIEWLHAREEPVPPRIAAALIADLADAVEHAHQRGVLHRDIKPGNILIEHAPGPAPGPGRMTAPPAPRLTDFGLARIVESIGDDSNQDRTRSGIPVGTPPYMAPEQAAGRSREIGPTTDIYALGIILYELLTGRPPFRGESATETLQLVQHEEPIPPRIWRPRLPRDLERICLTCLEKGQRLRYPSAQELSDDLRRFLMNMPIRARPQPSWRRIQRWRRRHRLAAGILSAIGLVLVSFVGTLAWSNQWLWEYNRRLAEQTELANRLTEDLASERDQAKAQHRLAARHFQVFRIRQAADTLAEGHPERAQLILRDIRNDRPSEAPAVDFAWQYLWNAARREIAVLSEPREQIGAFALDSSGQSLATADENGTISLRNARSGERIAALSRGHRLIRSLAFAPGDRILLDVGSSEPEGGGNAPRTWDTRLWNIEDGTIHDRLPAPEGSEILGAWFDARGRSLWQRIATADGPSYLERRLWPGSDIRSPLIREPFEADVLSDDGGWALRRGDGREWMLLDLDAGPSAQERPIALEGAAAIGALTSDGKLVAFGAHDGQLAIVWSREEGHSIARIAIPPGEGPSDWLALSFAPGDKSLVIRLEDGRTFVADVDRDGPARPINEPYAAEGPGRGAEIPIALDPQGHWAVLGHQDRSGAPIPPTLYDLDTGDPLKSFPGRLSETSSYRISRDGQSLYFITADRQLVRWNIDPEAWSPIARELDKHPDEVWAVAFSPDGSLLATGSDDQNDSKTLRLWDPSTGNRLQEWVHGQSTASALAFHPSGKILATVELTGQHTGALWDITAPQPRLVARLLGHTDRIRAVSFSTDGSLLATAGGDCSIRIWDGSAGHHIATLPGHDSVVRTLAFHPVGSLLASGGNDRSVRLWDLSPDTSPNADHERREPLIHEHPADVAALAFARDGSLMAIADRNGTITLRDARPGADFDRPLPTLRVENGQLYCVAFSPDGLTLAAAGASGEIHIWDVATGQQMLTIRAHQARINGLTFSPDGLALASCAHDGTVRLWLAPIAE